MSGPRYSTVRGRNGMSADLVENCATDPNWDAEVVATFDDARLARKVAGLLSQPKAEPIDLESVCRIMHEAYEAAAAEAGWETQHQSRVAWDVVPAANKEAMRRAVAVLLDRVGAHRS